MDCNLWLWFGGMVSGWGQRFLLSLLCNQACLCICTDEIWQSCLISLPCNLEHWKRDHMLMSTHTHILETYKHTQPEKLNIWLWTALLKLYKICVGLLCDMTLCISADICVDLNTQKVLHIINNCITWQEKLCLLLNVFILFTSLSKFLLVGNSSNIIRISLCLCVGVDKCYPNLVLFNYHLIWQLSAKELKSGCIIY